MGKDLDWAELRILKMLTAMDWAVMVGRQSLPNKLRQMSPFVYTCCMYKERGFWEKCENTKGCAKQIYHVMMLAIESCTQANTLLTSWTGIWGGKKYTDGGTWG